MEIKFISLLTILLLTHCSFSQISTSEEIWLPLNEGELGENLSSSAVLFTYEKDSIKVYNFFRDTLLRHKYKIIDAEHFIIYDTLTVQYTKPQANEIQWTLFDSINVSFRKVPDKKLPLLMMDFWDHEDWILHEDSYSSRVRLTREKYGWGGFKTDSTYHFMVQFHDDHGLPYINFHKWKLAEINNNQFFYTRYMDVLGGDQSLYHIISYDDHTVHLKKINASSEEDTYLEKILPMDSMARTKLLNAIVDRSWEIERLITFKNTGIPNDSELKFSDLVRAVDSSNYEENRSVLNNIDEYGFGREFPIDTTFFDPSSLTNKELIFNLFSNGTIEIKERDGAHFEGKWKLSKSGDLIIIDHGIQEYDYIQFKIIEPNFMLFIKRDYFQSQNPFHEGNPRFFDEIIYALKLKHNDS